MIIMSLLFILLLAFSVASLAVTDGQRKALIKKAWEKDEDQRRVVERNLDCCGLDNEFPCKDDKKSHVSGCSNDDDDIVINIESIEISRSNVDKLLGVKMTIN